MIAVSTRRRKQRGNTILESAMVFLPMMAMFFGVIDVCFAVSIQSLFSQAVRAGSRWAITYSSTYNGNTCTSQAACIASVVQDNAVGFLAGTKSNLCRAVELRHISNNLNDADHDMYGRYLYCRGHSDPSLHLYGKHRQRKFHRNHQRDDQLRESAGKYRGGFHPRLSPALDGADYGLRRIRDDRILRRQHADRHLLGKDWTWTQLVRLCFRRPGRSYGRNDDSSESIRESMNMKRSKSESGQAMLEFSIVTISLAFMFAGAFTVGAYLNKALQVSNVTRSAAVLMVRSLTGHQGGPESGTFAKSAHSDSRGKRIGNGCEFQL